jgi:hypothetical protein
MTRDGRSFNADEIFVPYGNGPDHQCPFDCSKKPRHFNKSDLIYCCYRAYFSRDYKNLSGNSPKHDIQKLRDENVESEAG